MIDTDETTRDRDDALRFRWSPHLDGAQAQAWRSFAERVPWAHYRQDPAWAEVECGAGGDSRAPVFFWAERGDEIRLTALGIRRRLPVPGRVFWEFDKGPTFLDAADLDEWLTWLRGRLGREAARLRLAPPMPLEQGGDDVETALERLGLERRRVLGGWATLLVDMSPDETALIKSFRSATQRSIRKSVRLGIEVGVEDEPRGWSVLVDLENELAQTTQVSAVDRERMSRISRCWLRGGMGGTVLVARHDGEPLAAALVIRDRRTAFLPMIPSSRRHRELPASHLLVWEAMRWARAQGCATFDMAGYSLVARPGESLWGINQFKRGFSKLDGLSKCVAIHEKVSSPLVVASAQAIRDAQERWHRRATPTAKDRPDVAEGR